MAETVIKEPVIKQNFVVMSKEEWTAEMVPLIAAEFRGIAEQFAAYWTETHHNLLGRNSIAGVYDGITGELLNGYRNGTEIIGIRRKRKRRSLH